jgi:peroxiredoxin
MADKFLKIPIRKLEPNRAFATAIYVHLAKNDKMLKIRETGGCFDETSCAHYQKINPDLFVHADSRIDPRFGDLYQKATAGSNPTAKPEVAAGPKITMNTSTTADIASLGQVLILDENGIPTEVKSLWRESKVMLIFLRHFACIACRAHAAQIWEKREFYEKNNTKVVFIGNGAPQYIQAFREDLKLGNAAIYTDPTLASFLFCGFKRGFLNVVSIASAANAIHLYKEGHRQTQLDAQGDHWQLGGVIIITPEAKVAFHFISESLGDYPPESDVQLAN